jgi:hypothetical protein
MPVVLAALVVALAAACGGEDAAPLTLEQRLVNEQDAPGSQPDPVETRIVARGIDNIRDLGEVLVSTDEAAVSELVARLKDDGFVAGISDLRFYPAEPGAQHQGDEAHVGTLVGRFDSNDGAADAVDALTEDGLRPCPEKCAFDISEFEVDGIPDATGVARLATAQSLEETGQPGEPHSDYTIRFADGPYAYSVIMFGPPAEVTEARAEEVAQSFYERVKGAPPPQG